MFGFQRFNVVRFHEVLCSVGGALDEFNTRFSVIFIDRLSHVVVWFRIGWSRVVIDVVTN